MIRSALKRGIKKVLGMPEREESPPSPPPAWKTDAPVKAEAAPVAAPAEAPVAAPVKVEAPVEVAPVEPPKAQKEWGPDTTPVPGTKIEAVQGEVPIISSETVPPSPVVAATMEPEDDTVGNALSFAAVQEIMDEMVRPALQGDGGDITLIRVENNDVYVKLVGSCSTCPSSIMTMKMGVEALLKEEFPVMGSLIQVE